MPAMVIVVVLYIGKVWAIRIKNKEKTIHIIKENILFFLLVLFFMYSLVISPSFSFISNLFDYIIDTFSFAN